MQNMKASTYSQLDIIQFYSQLNIYSQFTMFTIVKDIGELGTAQIYRNLLLTISRRGF